MDETELRQRLDPLAYHVTQEGGTERAFSGAYYRHKGEGMYQCVVCGADLFGSDTKYESGSGWPSYWQPASPGAVKTIVDRSHGMVRTEVRCGACDAHLGHLFDDGPQDKTGMRYCINSCALGFASDAGD